MTLQDYADTQQLDPGAALLVQSDYRGNFNAQLHEVSLLFALQQAVSDASLPESGVETMRIAAGNSALPLAMAKDLGSAVRLGAPVTRVDRHPWGVRVHTPGPVGRHHDRGRRPPGAGRSPTGAARHHLRPSPAGRPGGRHRPARPRARPQGVDRVPPPLLGRRGPLRLHHHRPALRHRLGLHRFDAGRRRATRRAHPVRDRRRRRGRRRAWPTGRASPPSSRSSPPSTPKGTSCAPAWPPRWPGPTSAGRVVATPSTAPGSSPPSGRSCGGPADPCGSPASTPRRWPATWRAPSAPATAWPAPSAPAPR